MDIFEGLDDLISQVPPDWEITTLKFPSKAYPWYSIEILPPMGHKAWGVLGGSPVWERGRLPRFAVQAALNKIRDLNED